MSCVSPNLQQVPAVRVEYGKDCRELFEAPEGRKLIDTDAAGLELRVLAHYMNDGRFTREVLEGDVHTANLDTKLRRLSTRFSMGQETLRSERSSTGLLRTVRNLGQDLWQVCQHTKG